MTSIDRLGSNFMLLLRKGIGGIAPPPGFRRRDNPGCLRSEASCEISLHMSHAA